MASIMRIRFLATLTGASRPFMWQSFWRPGTSGGTVADATDILTRVRTCLLAIQSQFSGGCSWAGVAEADVLEDSTGQITGTWQGVPGANVVGGAVGDALSPALCLVIRETTALIVGKRFLKGRIYLPGFTEGLSGLVGTPTGVNAGTVNNAFNALMTGGSTASFPVVWHRPNPAKSIVGTSGPITGYAMQPAYWGVQRRRRF